MTPQQLKNSILQRAIEGRLVEQRPEEGTAQDLLKEIQTEKARLVKEGKIKNTKALSSITEDEIPFDIPESWKWVRLGEIGVLERGSGLKRSEMTDTGKPCIRYGELYTTYQTRFSETVSHTSEEVFESCHKVNHGEIVMTLTGENKQDIAMAVTYEGQEEIAMGGDMTKWFAHGMNPLYLTYLINSPYCIACKQALATGNIIVHISNDKLSSILLPIPPLAEQHRIVAKIEELLPLIDKYDKAYTKLTDYNARFPEAMKKSLLQYAIQGKLVEQRAEEGTAQDLIKEIQAEKAHLVKEGKIKKSKPLPPITEEEKPFDIPDSWEWVRWGDLSQSIQYGYNAPAQTKGRIKMVRISDIQNNRVLWDTVPYCQIDEENIETYALKPNDILFARTGGTVGKSYLVTEVPEEAIYAGYLIRTRYSNLLIPQYLKFFMESSIYWEQLRNGTIATAQPNCNGKTLGNMILPLPPLAEQHRIVAKLEELLPFCDQLIK